MTEAGPFPAERADDCSAAPAGEHRARMHHFASFGEDWFGRKAEAFARSFGTPGFLIGQTLAVVISDHRARVTQGVATLYELAAAQSEQLRELLASNRELAAEVRPLAEQGEAQGDRRRLPMRRPPASTG